MTSVSSRPADLPWNRKYSESYVLVMAFINFLRIKPNPHKAEQFESQSFRHDRAKLSNGRTNVVYAVVSSVAEVFFEKVEPGKKVEQPPIADTKSGTLAISTVKAVADSK